MPLLLLFALIAGAGTAITPCVLPVLPALLSASALGGRRRPLGIVVGLASTFTIALLPAVTWVGAWSGASARVVAVAIASSIGLSAVLLLYGLGGRAVLDRIKRSARRGMVEHVLGGVLLATAVIMATNLDVRFEEAL